MINDFLKMFTNECISTIEGLTGKSAEFSEYKEFDVNTSDTLKAPLVYAIFNIANGGKIGILAGAILMSAIGEWMMGEEEITKNDKLGPDEMDAAKEAIQNIISAFSTTLGAQKDIPKMDVVRSGGEHDAWYVHDIRIGTQPVCAVVVYGRSGAGGLFQ